MKAFVYQANRGGYREMGTLVAPTRVHAIRRLRQHAYSVISLRQIVDPTTPNLQLYDTVFTMRPVR